MARPIWSGSISFGLVNVPVRLFSAIEQKDVHFRELDQKTGKRIHHKRVTEGSNREIEYEDVAKGYEVSKGHYVKLTKEELEAADPEKTRTIDREDVVELEEIDPIYFEKTYYLGPQKDVGAKRAYALLLKAFEDSGKAAVGRFVMRTKEYLVTVRPAMGILVLDTMYFADEVRDPKKVLDETTSRVKVEKKDLDMARRLIDSLTTDWDPTQYKDTYRKRILDLVHKKQQGKEIVVEEAEETESPPDLMEALRASVEAIDKRRKSKKPATKRRRKAS